MRPSRLRILAAALVLAGLGGCAQAPAVVVKPQPTPIHIVGNLDLATQPLQLMELAMDAHLRGYWELSNRAVERCLQMLHKRPQLKLGSEVGSALLSDQLRSHGGDAHELVFLHTLGMLNFAMLGRPTEGLVEARRSDAIQRWLAQEGKAAGDDPLGRMISAQLHEYLGQLDDAYIDLYKAWQAYEATDADAELPSFLIPELRRLAALTQRDISRERWAAWGKTDPRPKGSGELWVLVYSGRASVENGKVTVAAKALRGKAGVGSSLTPLDLVYDIAPLLEDARREKRLGRTLRNATRLAVRSAFLIGLAALGAGDAIGGEAAAKFLGGAVQDEAQHWYGLPARVHAARLWLPSGKQTLTVQAMIDGEQRELSVTAKIRPGRTALVQASFRDPHPGLLLSPSARP